MDVEVKERKSKHKVARAGWVGRWVLGVGPFSEVGLPREVRLVVESMEKLKLFEGTSNLLIFALVATRAVKSKD